MYLDESPQRHSSQRGSDIHFVEVQAYCLPMELASLLKVTFGLVLLVSQSLTQQELHRCWSPLLQLAFLRPGACLTWSRGILGSHCHILGVPWACRHALCPCRGCRGLFWGRGNDSSDPERGGSCRQRTVVVVVVGSGDVATDASDGRAGNSGGSWENGLRTFRGCYFRNPEF